MTRLFMITFRFWRTAFSSNFRSALKEQKLATKNQIRRCRAFEANFMSCTAQLTCTAVYIIIVCPKRVAYLVCGSYNMSDPLHIAREEVTTGVD